MVAQFKGSPAGILKQRINSGGVTTDVSVIAGVPGQSVRVYGMRLSVAGACIVSIKDGVAGTVLEVFNFAGAGGAVVLDLREDTFYETSTGNAFVIASSAAVQVDGRLEYFQSKA